MEEEEAASYKAHVLVLPFHAQGHMNPMFQFSKRLASHGVKVTVAATLSATKTLPPQVGSLTLESIYDDLSLGGRNGTDGMKGFYDRFQSIGSVNLTNLINKHQGSKYPIKCLVYDANLPWSLDIAKELGISGAAFFTQSCATLANYLQMIKDESTGSTKALPELGISNLPSVGSKPGAAPQILKFILAQLSNIDRAHWLLMNSFYKVEDQVIEDLLKQYPIMTVGPTVPSAYLDKRVHGDEDYGFNLYHSAGTTCINWLNTKETASVVYISFGSAASLDTEQIHELAWGIKQSNAYFLWVVRESEEHKLPRGFKEETSEKGLMVTWCSQLGVLSHKAVGCFVTHCGWNSTLEALSLGVPMVAVPQFLDQFSDAKFVEQVWEVGVRAKSEEKGGLVTKEEIERCIKIVMEGERGEEIKINASKWKELAKEAIDEGGTSDANIKEFVIQLVGAYQKEI